MFQPLLYTLISEANSLSEQGLHSHAELLFQQCFRLTEPGRYACSREVRELSYESQRIHFKRKKQPQRVLQLFSKQLKEIRSCESYDQELELLFRYKQELISVKNYKKALLITHRLIALLKAKLHLTRSSLSARQLVDTLSQASDLSSKLQNSSSSLAYLKQAFQVSSRYLPNNEQGTMTLRNSIRDHESRRGTRSSPRVVINLVSSSSTTRLNIDRVSFKGLQKIKDVVEIYGNVKQSLRSKPDLKFQDYKSLQNKSSFRKQRNNQTSTFKARRMNKQATIPDLRTILSHAQSVRSYDKLEFKRRSLNDHKLQDFQQQNQNLKFEAQQGAVSECKADKDKTMREVLNRYLKSYSMWVSESWPHSRVLKQDRIQKGGYRVVLSVIQNNRTDEKLFIGRIDKSNQNLFKITKLLSDIQALLLLNETLLRHLCHCDFGSLTITLLVDQHFANIEQIKRIQRLFRSAGRRRRERSVRVCMSYVSERAGVRVLVSAIEYERKRVIHFVQSLVKQKSKRIFYREVRSQVDYQFIARLFFFKATPPLLRHQSHYVSSLSCILTIQNFFRRQLFKKKRGKSSLSFLQKQMLRQDENALLLTHFKGSGSRFYVSIEDLRRKGRRLKEEISQEQSYELLKSSLSEGVMFDLENGWLYLTSTEANKIEIEVDQTGFGCNSYDYKHKIEYPQFKSSREAEVQTLSHKFSAQFQFSERFFRQQTLGNMAHINQTQIQQQKSVEELIDVHVAPEVSEIQREGVVCDQHPNKAKASTVEHATRPKEKPIQHSNQLIIKTNDQEVHHQQKQLADQPTQPSTDELQKPSYPSPCEEAALHTGIIPAQLPAQLHPVLIEAPPQPPSQSLSTDPHSTKQVDLLHQQSIQVKQEMVEQRAQLNQAQSQEGTRVELQNDSAIKQGRVAQDCQEQESSFFHLHRVVSIVYNLKFVCYFIKAQLLSKDRLHFLSLTVFNPLNHHQSNLFAKLKIGALLPLQLELLEEQLQVVVAEKCRIREGCMEIKAQDVLDWLQIYQNHL